VGERSDWVLKADDLWHGFEQLETDFNMLDPIKSTIVTPGLSLDGRFDEWGIPAVVVTKYLAEHGVIIEKTGLYSFFIMFTIGITKGRWNSLVAALQQFKDDFDKNQPLWRVLPEFVKAHPRYERKGLRELCVEMHEHYRKYDVARMTTEMYTSNMEAAMKPSDAYGCLIHDQVERVAIDDLLGRITGVLLTPYPPGIPLLIPGERVNSAIVNYLQFSRAFNQQFPGFDTDIHGLIEENGEYFLDCVKV
jgi:arginine decarboxylase